jgi:hypothetical protein
MKKVLVVVCAVAFCLGAASADAQVPYVQPYFDELQTVTILDECPTDPAGRLYIVAHNWGIFMSAIEYRIEYAPEITFLGDFIDEANILSIGSSPTGIALAWKNSPGVAFTSLRLQEVSVFYTCTACEVTNITVTVKKHPDSDPTPGLPGTSSGLQPERVLGHRHGGGDLPDRTGRRDDLGRHQGAVQIKRKREGWVNPRGSSSHSQPV